jgi:hypothetical protein
MGQSRLVSLIRSHTTNTRPARLSPERNSRKQLQANRNLHPPDTRQHWAGHGRTPWLRAVSNKLAAQQVQVNDLFILGRGTGFEVVIRMVNQMFTMLAHDASRPGGKDIHERREQGSWRRFCSKRHAESDPRRRCLGLWGGELAVGRWARALWAGAYSAQSGRRGRAVDNRIAPIGPTQPASRSLHCSAPLDTSPNLASQPGRRPRTREHISLYIYPAPSRWSVTGTPRSAEVASRARDLRRLCAIIDS